MAQHHGHPGEGLRRPRLKRGQVRRLLADAAGNDEQPGSPGVDLVVDGRRGGASPVAHGVSHQGLLMFGRPDDEEAAERDRWQQQDRDQPDHIGAD